MNRKTKLKAQIRKAGVLLCAAFLVTYMSLHVMASEEKTSFQDVGIDIDLSDVTQETQGYLYPYSAGAIDLMHHTYLMLFLYVAMPEEQYINWINRYDLTEEEENQLALAEFPITAVLATEDSLQSAGEEFDTLVGGTYLLDTDAAREIGSADGFVFYAVPVMSDDYLSGIEPSYADEYRELEQLLLEREQSASVYVPEDPEKELVGTRLTFTTTDLDGKTVTSEELFSTNEITMLNCWGTWCYYCMQEMEELAGIHTRMQEKGCGIVGLEYEQSSDESVYQEAKEQMETFGTNYPNVLMPEEEFSWVNAFPTSVFVDREGTILAIPISGARVDLYESTLDLLLKEREPESEEQKAALSESVKTAGYRVSVSDEDGPVEGVMIQLCDDTSCSLAETGADGAAVFEENAGGSFEVHVLAVPQGYQEDSEVYHLDASGEVTIQLKKAD